MNLKDRFKNTFLYNDKYKTDSEAVIIACYFNPQRNPYRLRAFRVFHNSIKHLNHRIVECVIGDSEPELIEEQWKNDNFSRVYTKDLLWHKETLLNNLVSTLPKEFKYVYWIDTDVIFTNKNWLVEGTQKMRDGANLVQPFNFCVHLEQDEMSPNFNLDKERASASIPQTRHPKVWRSFGYNHVLGTSGDQNYDKHGHVGFAWGARREVLDAVPLYDRALIGGADHIIAHAGAGQIGHTCITKSFTEDIIAVNAWSRKFYGVVKGKIEFVAGDLYHIWHGDIAKREYLKRVQEFTPQTKKITKKDSNGLYEANGDEKQYMEEYFNKREVKSTAKKVVAHSTYGVTQKRGLSPSEYQDKANEFRAQYPDSDDSFIQSLLMAYITDSTIMGAAYGGNIIGAMVGDALNTNDQQVDFGGGQGGGAGSGGTWEDSPSVSQELDNILGDTRPVGEQLDDMLRSDTTDYTTSSNFS